MKKVVSLIMGVLLILPISVFADMGAPEIKQYKVSITNPDGATFYEMQYNDGEQTLKKAGTIDFEKQIEITYETKINGKEYVSYYDENENNSIYIMASDVIAIDDEYDLKEATKINQKATILAEEGVVMHSGPAAGYKVVGTTIPKGEEITLTYEFSSEGLYYYTEYKNEKGWINIGEGSVGLKSKENNKFIVVNDIEIEDKNITIPANTIMRPKYQLDAWTGHFNSYIEYEDYEGLISDENLCYFGYKYYYKVKKSVKMYEKASKSSKVIDKEIRINDIFRVNCSTAQYDEDGWMYVTYAKQNGWIYYPGYEEENKYFINVDEEDLTKDELEELEYEEEVYEPKKTKDIEDDEDEIVIKDKKLNDNQILYICIGGAIVIALTALVSIKFVNKKKK